MIKKFKDLEILDSKLQIKLFGYKNYFNLFKKLYEKNKLPNVILLSGRKGIGKSTLSHHFINYVLSQNEENSYKLNEFEIDPTNNTYKLLTNETHQNFFLLNTTDSIKTIKIDHVRNLLNFLNKSVYSKNIRFVLIDNIEYLNLNSSNALLKAIEEPSKNTYFFLIHNDEFKIMDTIKSRSIQFRVSFTNREKKEIIKKLGKQYGFNDNFDKIYESFYFETPGNLLKFLSLFSVKGIDFDKDKLSSIYYLMDIYKNSKDPDLLNLISLFVEKFYNDLSFRTNKNLNYLFFNKQKILMMINDVKNYNLDKNNFLISLEGILKNESK